MLLNILTINKILRLQNINIYVYNAVKLQVYVCYETSTRK